jgi:hypothetical protein
MRSATADRPNSTNSRRGRARPQAVVLRERSAARRDIAAILDQPLTVKQGGTTRKMSAFEAGLRGLVKKALNNRDLRAILEFLRLCEKHGIIGAPPAALAGSGVNGTLNLTRISRDRQCGPDPPALGAGVPARGNTGGQLGPSCVSFSLAGRAMMPARRLSLSR